MERERVRGFRKCDGERERVRGFRECDGERRRGSCINLSLLRNDFAQLC